MFGPLLAPYGESAVVGDVWETSSAAHWLGTDNLGRDLFSRLLYGAQTSIAIALAITLLSFTIGVALGFFAAVIGGWADQVLSRLVDVLMAFPTLILALLVLSVLGSSVPVLIAVSAVLDSTRVFRLSRAVAMDVEVMDFVEVARLRGEGLWWIMSREVFPNTLPPLIAEFGLRFCFAFLFISALSLPRSRHPAAGRRLGRHGQGQRQRDQLRPARALDPGGRDRAAHHRRQPRGRLVPAPDLAHPAVADMLLEMKGLKIDGWSEDREAWLPIVKGVDVELARGEVLGLIGELGAGKSTIGLAALGYARHGCRISGGQILLDGKDIRSFAERQMLDLRGRRVAYVAQSAAAAFNPAHTLMSQITEAPVRHGVMSQARGGRRRRCACSGRWACRTRTASASATRTRSRAVSCSAR